MLIRDETKRSQNALKHGCCAKALLLPDECREDFDRIHNGWMAEFEPEGYQEQRLVELLILNDWFLQRAQRRLWDAEAVLCAGPEEPLNDEDREIWDAKKQHDLDLKQRYKTSCERAFYRAWNVLQGLRKDMERREWTLAKLEREKQKLLAQLEKLGVKGEPDGGKPRPEARVTKATVRLPGAHVQNRTAKPDRAVRAVSRSDGMRGT